MKKNTGIIFFALALAITQAGRGEGFLRAQGKIIVDGSGHEVQLRGVGLGNWLLPEGYMWRFTGPVERPRRIEKLVKDLLGTEGAENFWKQYRNHYIAEADIKRIAELGFNSVRPAINSRILMNEQNGEFLPEGFQLLDQLLASCRQYGLYCFLDLHGAVGGQTGKNIDDSATDSPELFTHPQYQDWTVKLWVEIARRYKDEPAVGGYDLLNEPLPNDFKQYAPLLEPFYKRLVGEMRKVDPRHMIILEGNHWATDFSFFGRPFQENLCYQFHKYWNAVGRETIQRYLDFRDKWNVPLWLGETGENSCEWFRASFQMFEDQEIGWSFWPWKKLDAKNAPYSIVPPEGWEKIQAFAADHAGVPREEAAKIFQQLLKNLLLENCLYKEEVVSAIFRRVPARVPAVTFGHRGQGISYQVKDPEFRSEIYRKNEAVPIEPLTQDYYVGWTEPGEWLAYEVDCETSNAFDLYFRMACPEVHQFFYLEVDGKNVTGRLEIPKTGDWERWKTFSKKGVPISKGRHQLRLVLETGGCNVDWFSVNPPGETDPRERVENGKMKDGGIGLVPGKVEAEQFGNGGLDVSYHVKDAHNKGGNFRPEEGVSLGAIATTYCIRLNAGEWVEYEINVLAPQPLALVPSLSAQGLGGPAELHMRLDGKTLRDPWKFGGGDWEVLSGKSLKLRNGKHQLRLLVQKGQARVGWVQFQ